MDVERSQVGPFPALVAGEGRPLVLLAGLSPDVGVDAPAMRRVHRATMQAVVGAGRIHYLNRRRGLRRGTTMAGLAAEHAEALRSTFGGPVDVLGMSTGGSIAQQLAADHPDVVRRLVLVATGCRLPEPARREQMEAAVAIRAGRPRRAFAALGASLGPRPLSWVLRVVAGIGGPRLFPDRAGLADMATTIEAEDAFDLAACPPIAAPTLLIGGGRDPYYPTALFEETAALIPDSRLDLHAGRGHVGVLGVPGLAATIAAFLA
jgi:pimeloyl-ACP methyl ester carboxylesterase